ncbi:MAG: LacI family DNA-binding transcriptional regulator [Eubacteriales bacterium]
MSATMKDIAKMTGLGLATISSYLNGGNVREYNRVKIEQAIEELHFEVNEVARGLKTNKTYTVGVVIPELNNAFFSEIITKMEDELRHHGYAIIICDCRSSEELEEQAVNFLYKKRVDGIISIPVSHSGKYLHKFVQDDKPILLVDRYINDINCDCIFVNNREVVRDATDKLVADGHRKIGMLGGSREMFTARERMQGYKVGLLENGIELEERLMYHGDYTIRSGTKGMEYLLEHNPEMTAVIAANYEMTVGAIIVLNEKGVKIPEELSIIGYDDMDFARACRPKLSIITQPTEEIGAMAAKLMLEKLLGKTREPQLVKLTASLIEGKSTITRDMQ